MKKFTILAMFIALVSSFSLRANEIVINRMHIWKNGVATSYLIEADLDSITFTQEVIQDDETNLPRIANPGAGKTTVVLYVPEDTPAGCYAVGSFDWDNNNTEKMFTAVATATNPRWVAYTFDWTEDLTFKVLAIPSDSTVALSWDYQWGKNVDPGWNDLTEDNVVILQGEGSLELENGGEPRLVGLADGGVCFIHVKAWATTPIIEPKPCETAAFKHPWGGGDWEYREATQTAEATFELNALYGYSGFNVATDIYGSAPYWYPESDIEFVGDVAQGDSVNVKFVSEKGTVGKLTVTLIEKNTPEIDDPVQETKDITVKAKVPASWTDVITAWVWPTNGEGKEVVLTKEGDWYVVTEHCVELNLIIKNGEGWDGYVRQEASVDITGIRENVCLVLESDGASKASYVNVDCEDDIEDSTIAEGIGVFSVGEGKTVTFSRGNLQYHPANNVWQFAESQTDYVGESNSNISATYDGWLDLFGWSTSTTNFGVSTSLDNNDYSGSFVDWGTNKIGNDAPNTWRTLSKDEWGYLFNTRTNASSLYGVAQVNGVNGMVVLPDDWTCPEGVTFKSGLHSEYVSDYSVYQSFTTEQWSKMEQAGAVFLPASGYRWGVAVLNVGDRGRYWSSTEVDEYYARTVGFNSDFLNPQGLSSRYDGFSVRLVKEIESESGTPDTASFPLISTVPEVIPMGYDGEVTIIFNPNEGNKGMQLATACYAHTGLITSASINDGDWQNVVENWRENTSKTQLTKDGNNWKLVISNIYDFYGCPADTEIKKLAFVFHDGPGGSREGKTAEGTDIFVVLEEVEEPEDKPASGVFSVGEGKTVTFSPGNLQYTQSTNTWSFASAQWEVLGFDNVTGGSVSSDPTWGDGKEGTALADKIDLFGWGTGNAPTKSSIVNSDYLTFVDWGTNQIGNDTPNTWRTLSADEWGYIFYNRENAQSLFALGSVNGVNGTIILPDNWTTPAGVSFVASTTKGLYWNGSNYYNDNEDNYSHNTYTSEQWSKMEQAGAVFLPVNGDRWGTDVWNAGSVGYYWSSTAYNNNDSYTVYFLRHFLDPHYDNSTNTYGCSVRLVKDVEGESDTPTTPNNPEEPTDPEETEGANDYMLDNFKIGGYGFFDLGDPLAGTDTLLTLSTGDEVTCQLAPAITCVWDNGITWGYNGLTGAGYFFRVENYVYTITDSPNGTYNGYIILGDAISGFDLAVDTIASEDILPYTGKAGQLLDVDMYGDAWDSLYSFAEDTIDEEYYNAIMDKYYAAQTGTQFYYYDFNADAQIIYSGNVSYLYLKEDNQTGELYYDLKLEWYDNVNEGRSYGLLAETEVNEEGEKIITGIVKPYDMRFIHKHYQQLPSTEKDPTEAPARVQAKAEVRAIYNF